MKDCYCLYPDGRSSTVSPCMRTMWCFSSALPLRTLRLPRTSLTFLGRQRGSRPTCKKSNVLPIRCEDTDISTIQTLLPCALVDFPCKYLGLPLSLKRLTKEQVQPYIDRIADQLQGWKANLMTKAGRRVQVQFVLIGMLIYLFMVVEFPAWAIKAIDKIRRGFLWRGRREARGGHCVIAWLKVCRPKELGGLGISDLKTLGWSLKMRWIWLQKTEPNRPWADFNIHMPEQIRAFFRSSRIYGGWRRHYSFSDRPLAPWSEYC